MQLASNESSYDCGHFVKAVPIITADSFASSQSLYLKFRHFVDFGEGELPHTLFANSNESHTLSDDPSNTSYGGIETTMERKNGIIDYVRKIVGTEMKVSNADVTVMIPNLGLIHLSPDATLYKSNAMVFGGPRAMESATCCLTVFKIQPTMLDIRRAIINTVLVSISASRCVPMLLTNLQEGGFQLKVQKSPTGTPIVTFTPLVDTFILSVLHFSTVNQLDFKRHYDSFSNSYQGIESSTLFQLQSLAKERCQPIEVPELPRWKSEGPCMEPSSDGTGTSGEVGSLLTEPNELETRLSFKARNCDPRENMNHMDEDFEVTKLKPLEAQHGSYLSDNELLMDTSLRRMYRQERNPVAISTSTLINEFGNTLARNSDLSSSTTSTWYRNSIENVNCFHPFERFRTRLCPPQNRNKISTSKSSQNGCTSSSKRLAIHAEFELDSQSTKNEVVEAPAFSPVADRCNAMQIQNGLAPADDIEYVKVTNQRENPCCASQLASSETVQQSCYSREAELITKENGADLLQNESQSKLSEFSTTRIPTTSKEYKLTSKKKARISPTVQKSL